MPLLKGVSKLMGDAPRSRYRLLWLLLCLCIAFSLLTRIVLYLRNIREATLDPILLLEMFSIGFLFDLTVFSIVGVPASLGLLLVPQNLFASKWNRRAIWAGFFLLVFGLFYLGATEYYFFEEFNLRFNSVAVDYLVYPQEVFENIWDSFPVFKVFVATVLLAGGIVWLLRRQVRACFHHDLAFARRLILSLGYLIPASVLILLVSLNFSQISENRIVNELACNGVFNFIHALKTNRLEYDLNYITRDQGENFQRLRGLLKERNSSFNGQGASASIVRTVVNPGPEKHKNVVIIVEESLSLRYVGSVARGPEKARRSLTPELDALFDKSLVFTNFYATGTRTVRGLEAINASFAPIPGMSVMRRENYQGIFTLAEVLRDKGYETLFIYGGVAYFDNMGPFMLANGVDRIVDRLNMKEKTFATVWGQCDEDTFNQALREFDSIHARGKPFFAEIMTVSNHRPYTFPQGKGKIPARLYGKRDGAVRYADYALGDFLRKAKGHPFFDDTLFVVVADHWARVAGRQEIPMYSYHIPLFLYAPKFLEPGIVATLGTQMDLAPTILGLLDITYTSTFMGRDLLKMDPEEGRLLVSHNHDVGYYRNGIMVVLGLRGKVDYYTYDPTTYAFQKIQDPGHRYDQFLDEAVAYFQTAYYLYENGLYRIR